MEKKYKLSHYLYKYRVKYILGILTLFAVDIINTYIPQFTGEVTDGLTARTLDMSGVYHLIIKILLCGLAIALCRFLWRYFIFGSARAIEYDMRNDLFAHLETLSMNYYNKNKTGDLMAHFTSDLNAIRMSVGMAVISSFDSIFMTIMILIKMFFNISISLTLLASVPLIIIAFASIWYGKNIKIRFEKKQEAFSNLTDVANEDISGVRVIKAFVRERSRLKEFAKYNQDNMDKTMDVVKLQAVAIPLLDIITGLSSLITLVYGGSLAIMGKISLGQFIAFNQYIGMLVWPMLAIGESITTFSQGKASLNRVYSIFSAKSEIIDNGTYDKPVMGDIELNHLSFKYEDKTVTALNDITFKVNNGESLAIVGKTGCGKTTLVNLLLRMYNVDNGMIKIDGIDINDYKLKHLRESFAYVLQDNFLFSDTITNNIGFGSSHPTMDMITSAAKNALIHDNIMDFKDGYETLVGERGVTISGGQKQRSAIARALLKDAPILILDDSLSAVDTDTEEKILNNLSQIRKGKTSIIIAHRISTIMNADKILVLDDGNMAEYGTFDELVKKGGIFATMYEKQQLEKQIDNDESNEGEVK